MKVGSKLFFTCICTILLGNGQLNALFDNFQTEGFAIGVQSAIDWHQTPKTRDRSGAGLRNSDRTSNLWGAYLAHYWSIEHRPLEVGMILGYSDNGSSSLTYNSGNRYKFRSWEGDLLLGLNWFFYDQYYLMGKLGAAYVHQTYGLTTHVSGAVDNNSRDTEIVPVFALGLGRRLSDGYKIFLESKCTLGRNANRLTEMLRNESGNEANISDSLYRVARIWSFGFGIEKVF